LALALVFLLTVVPSLSLTVSRRPAAAPHTDKKTAIPSNGTASKRRNGKKRNSQREHHSPAEHRRESGASHRACSFPYLPPRDKKILCPRGTSYFRDIIANPPGDCKGANGLFVGTVHFPRREGEVFGALRRRQGPLPVGEGDWGWGIRRRHLIRPTQEPLPPAGRRSHAAPPEFAAPPCSAPAPQAEMGWTGGLRAAGGCTSRMFAARRRSSADGGVRRGASTRPSGAAYFAPAENLSFSTAAAHRLYQTQYRDSGEERS